MLKVNRISNNLFFLALLPAFTACIVTEKQRRKICDSCPAISKSYDSVVIKTVTVPVQISGAPGPTLYLENPCAILCDSLGRLRNIDSSLKANGSALNVRRIGNTLAIGAATTDKTVAAAVQQTVNSSKTETTLIQRIPCQNERTSFDGFCRWFFYITAPTLGLYAVYKYLRWRYWKPPKTG